MEPIPYGIRFNRRIQFLKYRKLMNPIICLVASFVIFFVLSELAWTKYLVLACFAWYVILMQTVRINVKKTVADNNKIVAPLHGKIKKVSESAAGTRIEFAKATVDYCDIHSPWHTFTKEGDMFLVDQQEGTFRWQFIGKEVLYVADPDGETGIPLGVMFGKGSCVLYLPANCKLNIAEGDLVNGGLTILGEILEESESNNNIE